MEQPGDGSREAEETLFGGYLLVACFHKSDNSVTERFNCELCVAHPTVSLTLCKPSPRFAIRVSDLARIDADLLAR